MKGQENMKKLKLKRWVRVVIYIIVLIILSYIIISFFNKKEVIITEGKNYTCHGSKLLQVCSGTTYEE